MQPVLLIAAILAASVNPYHGTILGWHDGRLVYTDVDSHGVIVRHREIPRSVLERDPNYQRIEKMEREYLQRARRGI